MALFTERYVQPIESKMDVETTLEESDALPTLEKYIIAPRLFKHLIGKNHPEFSTNRQQDASEYFTHFLDLLDKNEKGQLTRLCNGTNEKLTSTIFTYHMQTRYQCAQTGEVKYSKRGPATLYNMVNLTIPLEAATISSERDPDLKRPKLDEGESPDTTQTIPFEACLTSYFQVEDIEMFNPTLAGNTICKKTIRFETFPRYLMLKLERYYIGENWTTKKIAARIPVPEHLDLTQYEGKGLQEFEREMPDPDANTQAPVGGGPVFDAGMLDQLLSMGFTENGAKRSLQATGNNDVEMALAWALDHSGDHDFNDPVVTTGGANAQSTPGVDPDAIAMLTSMGYTEEQTMAALKCSDNNIER